MTLRLCIVEDLENFLSKRATARVGVHIGGYQHQVLLGVLAYQQMKTLSSNNAIQTARPEMELDNRVALGLYAEEIALKWSLSQSNTADEDSILT